jgi:hypothetical protein
MLLDLSAAFDTTGLAVLLTVLDRLFGIHDKAIKGLFRSHLGVRSQTIV